MDRNNPEGLPLPLEELIQSALETLAKEHAAEIEQWKEKFFVAESQVENADANLEQVRMAMKSNHAREIAKRDAAIKVARDALEKLKSFSEYLPTNFCEKTIAQIDQELAP